MSKEYESTYRKHISVDSFAPEKGERIYAVNSSTEEFLGSDDLETFNVDLARTFQSLEEAVEALPDTGIYVLVASSANFMEPENISDDRAAAILSVATYILNTYGQEANGIVTFTLANLSIAASSDGDLNDITIASTQTGEVVAEFSGSELTASALAPDDIFAFEALARQLDIEGQLAVPEIADSEDIDY
ncbi:MAG: hypothetical protein AAFY57_20120 [Cyanobacteria bacterium J06642_2]